MESKEEWREMAHYEAASDGKQIEGEQIWRETNDFVDYR